MAWPGIGRASMMAAAITPPARAREEGRGAVAVVTLSMAPYPLCAGEGTVRVTATYGTPRTRNNGIALLDGYCLFLQEGIVVLPADNSRVERAV
ncbi:hypothetical protein A11A3_07103 [Alcanivorax hongdengensis A-11-3]|uniref:Uncharacterized protein n=1 Tax=Alcanivorax hongdengensis A-11-3 TaxID=1177179 RepID=L0WCU1_9GAMM|nr:hypothetical protein A11A3_07103 [Alcanivorax hongdengensis A-11-3]